MRKHLTSRIFGLAALYVTVFCVLVIFQFSSKGNFSLPAGSMTIRGRYIDPEAQSVTGGIRVFFGGIEFGLREERGKGLMLTGANGEIAPVNPEFIAIDENTARFVLPGGTTLVFNSSYSSRGPELQINAVFADNVAEVTIPISARRASTIRDNDQLGVMYSGYRFFFAGSGQELEDGRIVLSRGNTFTAYRSRGKEQAFDPANFVIEQAANYDQLTANWIEASYDYWRQNTPLLHSENDVMGFLSESLRRGTFRQSLESIPADFMNSSRRTFRSSGYLGGMTAAFRTFDSAENEKMNLITSLIRERSLNLLREDHIIDFLFARNNSALALDVIDIIDKLNPERLTAEHCAGLLEAYSDIARLSPTTPNPVEPLIEKILSLTAGTLTRDTGSDLVFSSGSDSGAQESSLRMGLALIGWADSADNAEWAAIGRSLVLSALTSSGAGAGSLYNILRPGDYYPRAALLMTNAAMPTGGLWAWTVSPNIRAAFNADGNLSIAANFPANTSHHMIIRGVPPFYRIIIHGMDWRSDPQFENYDASGWVYHPQEQTLVLKLRHRVAVENVLLVYRAPPPPADEENSDEAGN